MIVQISTRTKDYIVDALALRLEMHRLGKVFANPEITKVQWLLTYCMRAMLSDCGGVTGIPWMRARYSVASTGFRTVCC